jgi:hypothetical protein
MTLKALLSMELSVSLPFTGSRLTKLEQGRGGSFEGWRRASWQTADARAGNMGTGGTDGHFRAKPFLFGHGPGILEKNYTELTSLV